MLVLHNLPLVSLANYSLRVFLGRGRSVEMGRGTVSTEFQGPMVWKGPGLGLLVMYVPASPP